MAVMIALRPDDDHGREILDRLEKRTEVKPFEVLDDGARRYHLEAEDSDLDAFDPMLDEIDRNWRNHLTNWRD